MDKSIELLKEAEAMINELQDAYVSHDGATALRRKIHKFIAAQQSVHPTVAKCAPDQHDFSKGLECAKCGELLF